MSKATIKKVPERCPSCNKAGTNECARVECGNRKPLTVGEPVQGYMRICGGFKRMTVRFSGGGQS